jgi:hypothetical protein
MTQTGDPQEGRSNTRKKQRGDIQNEKKLLFVKNIVPEACKPTSCKDGRLHKLQVGQSTLDEKGIRRGRLNLPFVLAAPAA